MNAEDTQTGLFDQIKTLTSQWNDYDEIPKFQQAKCRDIGRKLNTLGGMDLMVEAYRFAKGLNPHVAVIQAYWDGIGNWQW